MQGQQRHRQCNIGSYSIYYELYVKYFKEFYFNYLYDNNNVEVENSKHD